MMLEKESVGSNSLSTSPISGMFSPSSNTCNTDAGKVKGPCFSCGQPGHWARDCPSKTPTSRRQLHLDPPSSPPSADPSRVVYCPCGAGICTVKVSRQPRSSGRKFYSCPLYPSPDRCEFFKWYDELSSNDVTYDAPICRCAAGPCNMYQETDGPNAGRKFFVCPIKKGQGACDFSQLVGATTDSNSKEGTTSSPSIVTHCPEDSSPNSDSVKEGDFEKQKFFQEQGACGSSLFMNATDCHSTQGTTPSQSTLSSYQENSSANGDPVKEGDCQKQKFFEEQGACGSSRFVDATDCHSNQGTTPSQSTLTSCHESGSANSVSVEEDDFSRRVQEIELSVLTYLKHAQQSGTVSEPSRRDKKKMPLMDCLGREETFDEPLRKHHKRLRHGALKIDSFPPNFSSDGWDLPQSKPEDPRPAKQAEIPGQISPSGASITGASSSSFSSCYSSLASWNCLESAVHQILGFQFRGWYGQLVFPPSRSLAIPPPKPFFCCIFPSFDPICDPQDVNMSNADAAAIVPYNRSSAEPNMQSSTKMLSGRKITQSIEGTLQKAAMQIQNSLLTILESSDIHDHEDMGTAANLVFVALEALPVDYQPFKQQAMEFILTAASLSEAELSIQNDNCMEDLVERYNSQKQELEKVSHLHAETWATLRASNERLESLRKELARIEEALFFCEAENVEIVNRLEQVSEEKMKSEQSLQAVSMEVEEARKLYKQREADRSVAEASFKAAKFKVQQNFRGFVDVNV